MDEGSWVREPSRSHRHTRVLIADRLILLEKYNPAFYVKSRIFYIKKRDFCRINTAKVSQFNSVAGKICRNDASETIDRLLLPFTRLLYIIFTVLSSTELIDFSTVF